MKFPIITVRDILILGLIIAGFIVGILLAGCKADSPPEPRFEVGYNDTEEWGIVFWAYVEPSDTIWFTMKWSWGFVKGADGTGSVAVKNVTELEDITWAAWTKKHEPKQITWKPK